MSFSQMKVVLRAARNELVFLDQLDLVSARHRAAYVKQAVDLGLKEEVIKHDIASIYRQLEQVQEEMVRKSLEPKLATRPAMSEDDLREAMAFCRDPQLLARILSDFDRCGVVGERTNKLLAYLAAVSRLLDDPIAIIVQSSSAAGKTK